MRRSRDIKNLRSRWWGKLRNLLSYANFHRLFSRKAKIVVVEIVPFINAQLQMIPQNSLGSLVIEGSRLGEGPQNIGSGGLRGTLSAMDHESRVFAGLAAFGSQIGDYSDGGNRSC